MKKTITKVKSVITGAIVLSAVALTHPYWSVDEYTVTVTNTETKNELNLVYTENNMTFQVSNTYAFLRTRAADDYGNIKPGGTYNFSATGHRNGVLDMYPNIISYEEIK